MNKIAGLTIISFMLLATPVLADDCTPTVVTPKHIVHKHKHLLKPVLPNIKHKVVKHVHKKIKPTDCNKDTLVKPVAPIGCYCSSDMLTAINDGNMTRIDEIMNTDVANHGHNVACLIDRSAYYLNTDKNKAYELYQKAGPYSSELVDYGCANSVTNMSTILTQIHKDEMPPGNPDIIINHYLPPTKPNHNNPSPE